MRRLRFSVVRLIERVVGRRQLVRAARFALDYARRDLPNRMASNGELLVQDIVRSSPRKGPLTVLDVGANVGLWSRRLLEACEQGGERDVVVHAFEPSPRTYAQLVDDLGQRFGSRLVPVNMAASDVAGSAMLYGVHDLAGSNSLHGLAGATSGLQAEAVQRCRLDDYCAAASIERVDLLKIDAEGHDMLVMEGAREMLRSRAIELVQFEYNFRWIGARRYLQDVFNLALELGWRVGKVTPDGVEWYECWDSELETFREGNYLMGSVAATVRFPSIEWWAAPATCS